MGVCASSPNLSLPNVMLLAHTVPVSSQESISTCSSRTQSSYSEDELVLTRYVSTGEEWKNGAQNMSSRSSVIPCCGGAGSPECWPNHSSGHRFSRLLKSQDLHRKTVPLPLLMFLIKEFRHCTRNGVFSTQEFIYLVRHVYRGDKGIMGSFIPPPMMMSCWKHAWFFEPAQRINKRANAQSLF